MPLLQLANRRSTATARRQDDVPANLNTVRGLACLLVVALHVVGDEESNGLHLPMTSGWHYAMTSIEFIRIPLFTALSGYLYAGHRVIAGTFGRFWTKKLRRLGVPLIGVTAVMWLLLTRGGAQPVPLWQALSFSFGHLWYIQALMLLFAAISVCDGLFRPGRAMLMLAGLAAVMVDQSGWHMTTFFSLDGTFYLAPYFLFGMILRENPEWLGDRSAGWMALGVVTIILGCQQLGLQGLMAPVTALELPAALAGMAGVLFLLQRFPETPLLAVIGGYSYTIYLWHVAAGAAARAVLIKAGIVSIPVLFPPIFAAAVTAPIVLYHVARRVSFVSVAVTGETRYRRARRDDRPMSESITQRTLRRLALAGSP
nr:acyltransferase [uncultured Rhodopila sp.]